MNKNSIENTDLILLLKKLGLEKEGIETRLIPIDLARRFISRSITSIGSRVKYRNNIMFYELGPIIVTTDDAGINVYPAINDELDNTFIIELIINDKVPDHPIELQPCIFDYGTAGGRKVDNSSIYP